MQPCKLTRAALLLSLLLCQGGCGDSIIFDCERKTVSTQASPDRRWEAEVLSVGCGATTPLAIQVQVRRVGFPSWLNRSQVVSVAETSEAPLISWTDSQTLEISWVPSARIFQKATSLDRVEILYPRWGTVEASAEAPSPSMEP